jgi:hypothetical protein
MKIQIKQQIKDLAKKYRDNDEYDSDLDDLLDNNMFKNNFFRKQKSDISVSKLLDECGDLNHNLLRTSQILGSLDINKNNVGFGRI